MSDRLLERIPFNRAFIAGKELFYISQAVLRGQLAGDGRFTELCSRWMEDRFGARRVMLTHSCTGALEMAAILCGIEPGDEVIMPSYTFVTTANAFVLRGARIRFVDIRPDTLNLDEERIEEAVNERTRVIVPVHYAGVGCEMSRIMEIARARGLRVVEDAAQGVNATYKDQYLGTIGDLGCYSFHETKNFISGEGGALVVNDPELIERAEVIREKGTNRAAFRKGAVDKYTWVDLGSSYLPGELVAAFLYAQLEESEVITHKRRSIWARYEEALRPLHEAGLLRIPECPAHCHHNAHMFYVLLPTAADRDRLIEQLAEAKVQGIFHYVPLHDAPYARKLGWDDVKLPNTEDLAARIVRLPCYFDLSEGDQDRVIREVREFVGAA